jgi:putative ATP-dependent endonuclease of OLD family
MIIKAIRVQNFRSIKDEVLECDKLTALVGSNGAGKSAFLKALDLFYTVAANYTEDDFYAKDTTRDIVITTTFTALAEEENELFQKYVEGGELTVEKEMKWPTGKGSQKYYGMSLQNPEFGEIRKALLIKDRGKSAKTRYEEIRSQDKYNSLPTWTTIEATSDALKDWEENNQDKCMRRRDEGQFFGFKEVGETHLERHTRFLLIPAVRDAAEDAAEGKGRVLSEIMDLVVRSVLAQREDIKELQKDAQKTYNEITDPSNLTELKTLEDSLTETLKTYVPDTQVNLTWEEAKNIEIPMPRADVKLVEDGYPSPVERTGHGLQRAFILTMLQHLAVAQAPRRVGDDAKEPVTEDTVKEKRENEEKVVGIQMPNLILGIEEPELYQHPNRQRHLSKILYKLATGGIKGVAEQTQVIYSTHSPLFVDIDRFKHVRLIRKTLVENDKPKQTKVFQTTLDDIAEIIEKADYKPKGTYSGDTLQPRLKTLMTPWMNEGFFADLVVLVEGEEDRAAILGVASTLGYDLESLGISVIPCMGKNNVDRPTAIFRKLQIPVYAIWDSDYGNAEAKAEENHRLLRLFGQEIEDWPEKVADQFTCFRQTLTLKLQSEIGEEFFNKELEGCCTRLCLGRKKYAVKNPIIMQEIIERAKKNNRKCDTLEKVIGKIITLKDEPVLNEA